MAVKILSKEIYELIAAGEVVSRPKFVVKELVENSVDAGAKSISVEIKNGGKSFIRVVDDGVGMSLNDCKLAFLRHATSKILTKSDLNSVKTLGFRGEALASICAVSKVEVLTKMKNSSFGTHYVNFGGVEQMCESVNCSDGTNFKLEQLFYNVPARLKFLKTDLTESNLIQEILEKLAISNYNVAFKFKKNGKQVFQTLGNGNLIDAIYSIYGKDVCKSLIPVQNVFSNVEVMGFVSKPIFCKSRGNLNLSFVNSRYVESKIFKNAVNQAFEGFVMVKKVPSYVLFLKMPYSDIDINVHPAKIQVRFVNESEVFKAIYLSIKKAIEQSNDVFEQNKINFVNNFNKNDVEIEKNIDFNLKNNSNELIENFENNFIECGMSSEIKNYKIDNENFSSSVNYDNFNFNKNFNENLKNDDLNELKLIGEVFKTYILAEFKNKFIVVDKHAAHERIIYEHLKKNLNNFEKQLLIKPFKVSVSSVVDCDLILKNINAFSYFGFDLESFGQRSFLLRCVPAFLDKKNCLEIFHEIVENLRLNKFDLTPSTIEDILHSMACKAAIKANDLNTKEQLFELVKQIYYNKNVRTCPHGRPVILVFNKEKFDSEFKRI